MTLWELDPGKDRANDDKVAKLTYPSINIPLTCTTDWDYHGSSAWLSPSSGASAVSADFRIKVSKSRVTICRNPENGCF